jgi:ABC-2 type transport system ATP-binding protein
VDSRAISPRELAQIGYVSENQDLPGRLTVGEYLDYLRPLYRRWDRALETSTRCRMR